MTHTSPVYMSSSITRPARSSASWYGMFNRDWTGVAQPVDFSEGEPGRFNTSAGSLGTAPP